MIPLPPGQTPRAWQIEAVKAAKLALQQYPAIILSAATGTGKGSVIAGLGIMTARRGRRVLMLAHRTELIEELRDRVLRVPGAPSVGIVKAQRNEMLNPIVVASVQSLGEKRLRQLGKVDLILTDECFPAGTPIELASGGCIPIEQVTAGMMVRAFDEEAGGFVARPVLGTMRRETTALVRVVAGGREVTCTPNHPFLTPRGWVPAGLLTTDHEVLDATDATQPVPEMRTGVREDPPRLDECLLRPVQDGAEGGTSQGSPGGLCGVWDGSGGARTTVARAVGEFPPGLLQRRLPEGGCESPSFGDDGGYQPGPRWRADACEQPDAHTRGAAEDVCDAACDRASAAGCVGEWPRDDEAAGDVAGAVGRGLDGGAGDPNGATQGQRVSAGVQGGHWAFGDEDRGGSGRGIPPRALAEGGGSEEGRVARWVRVDRVAVLERGDSEGAGSGGGACEVFNFEVAGVHTYVAGGFVVHNCHHALAPSYGAIYDSVLAENPNSKHIGFTATAFRTGKKRGETLGLGRVFQCVAYQYTIAEAIAAGDLVPPRGFQVSTSVSLEGVRVGADGDFLEEDLAKVLDVPARNDLVVAEYLMRTPGQPALVFCTSIEHSQHMAEAFMRAGVKAAAVWGVMGAQKRRELIGRYKERKGIDVLCSRDLIFEGFDAPATAAIYQARPTQSRVVFVQMIGRGLRLYPGKTECQVVSFVDNAAGLDLASLADLSDDAPNDRAQKALGVGDEVIRRTVEGWGVGVIRSIEPSDEIGPAVYHVAWPASICNPVPKVCAHAQHDLKRKPAEEEREEGEVRVIESKITGVQRYEVFLLPGASPKTAPGWYEYNGSWSASVAVVGRPTWTPAGFVTPSQRHTLHVQVRGGAWGVYDLQRNQGAEDVIERIGSADSQHKAMELAQQRMAVLGAKPTPIDADWKAHPASDRQKKALRSWGIRRDMEQMSRGEASALMDSVIAYRLVNQLKDTQQVAA